MAKQKGWLDKYSDSGIIPQAQKGKKVIIDGKEYDTSSEEYKDLYRWGPNDDGKGGIGYFDKDRVLVTGKTTLPEVVVFPKDKDTKKFYDKLGDSDQYAFEQMVKKYGPVNITKNKGTGIFSGTAGHYNPFADQITINPSNNLSRDKDTYLAELAHKVQFDRQGKFDVMGNWVFNDLPGYVKHTYYGLKDDYDIGNTDETMEKWFNSSPYNDPSTMEYQAHSTIEPTLKDEFFNYSSDDMMGYNYNKFKSGGKLDNYGEEANANEGYSSAPKEWIGEGYSNVGRDYSPAWGGQFAMGGSLPGATGFMYARTGAPSNGPYAKKTLPSAQEGDTVPIDPAKDPKYSESIAKSLQYINDWMNSPKYKEMLSNSVKGRKRKYEKLDKLRKSAIQDENINYYEEPIDPKTPAETKYIGKGKSNIYLNPNSAYDYWNDFILHELFHANDAGGIGIPLSDKKLIYKYATRKMKNSPFYERAKETNSLDELKEFTNYINTPTETRARINNLRSSMRDQKVYDPFTESFSKDMFDKYKQMEINEEGKKEGRTIGMDPYQQLKMTYTDEEIEDMMNKISKTKDNKPKDNDVSTFAQNGASMTYYQNGLDWKPKSISRDGSVIKDDNGYWNPDNWGKVVEIDSPDITMQGVDQDLIGISDEGDVKYMTPGKDYKFKGKKVKEYPVGKNGINQQDEKVDEQLDQLTNFTNYNKPTKGGWLDKYN
jgi:hypothetical protein